MRDVMMNFDNFVKKAEEPAPSIDWGYWKESIASPNVVAEFEKAFEAAPKPEYNSEEAFVDKQAQQAKVRSLSCIAFVTSISFCFLH